MPSGVFCGGCSPFWMSTFSLLPVPLSPISILTKENAAHCLLWAPACHQLIREDFGAQLCPLPHLSL